jgi:hypothetical protein
MVERVWGYERVKRKGNLVPSEANVAKKHHYLRTFFPNRAKPPGERLREVYTDESYIHEHYHRNEDSLYNPMMNKMSSIRKRSTKAIAIASVQLSKAPIH